MADSLDKTSLKIKIEEHIAKSKLDIIEMKSMTQPISPENSIGRISRMDAINNKSVMEAALRNKKRKLSKLQMALSNIDNPSFGICADCKNPIQQARIIYMPESTLCVRCASR